MDCTGRWELTVFIGDHTEWFYVLFVRSPFVMTKGMWYVCLIVATVDQSVAYSWWMTKVIATCGSLSMESTIILLTNLGRDYDVSCINSEEYWGEYLCLLKFWRKLGRILAHTVGWGVLHNSGKRNCLLDICIGNLWFMCVSRIWIWIYILFVIEDLIDGSYVRTSSLFYRGYT